MGVRTCISQKSTMALTTKLAPLPPPHIASVYFLFCLTCIIFFLVLYSLCLFHFSFVPLFSLTAVVYMGLSLQLDNHPPPSLSRALFLSSCSPVVIKTIRPYNDSAGVWVWSLISVQLIDLLANYPPFRSKSQRLFLSPFDKC